MSAMPSAPPTTCCATPSRFMAASAAAPNAAVARAPSRPLSTRRSGLARRPVTPAASIARWLATSRTSLIRPRRVLNSQAFARGSTKRKRSEAYAGFVIEHPGGSDPGIPVHSGAPDTLRRGRRPYGEVLGGLAHFLERAGLDLPDAFTRHLEFRR